MKITTRDLQVRFVTTLAFALLPLSLWATPSGLGDIPDINIPKRDGKSLPVEFRAHYKDPHLIYVKPNFGEFKAVDSIKTAANCDALSTELKTSRSVVNLQPVLLKSLERMTLELDGDLQKLESLRKETGQVDGVTSVYAKKAERLTADIAETRVQIKRLQSKIDEIDDNLQSKHPANSDELQKEKQSLQTQEASLEDDLLAKKKELRKIDSQSDDLGLATAGSKAEIKELEEKITKQSEAVMKLRDTIQDFDKSLDETLKKYSNQVGGYLTLSADFAPSEYLEALQNANPGKRFAYVPSKSATVDMVGPEIDSSTDRRIGDAIIAAKWSNAAKAREGHVLSKVFLKAFQTPEALKDPTKPFETLLKYESPARYENTLSGGKFLSLTLSVFGYCALQKPESLNLPLENKGGKADMPFKLALYYTYPEYYAIKMDGTYHAFSMLHEFWKYSSSSSWFGLSKKQKVEHMKNYSQDTYVNIKVEPEGVTLSQEDSLALSEKIKEQLVFFTMRPYLQFNQSIANGGTPFESQTPGAELSSIGRKLMFIPNPYTFWGGVVLSSLGGMFGQSAKEISDTQTSSTHVLLHYDNGIILEAGGEVLIGNLKEIANTNLDQDQ